MGKIRITKIREIIATVFVLTLVVVFAAFLAAYAGKDIPILRNITGFFGVGQ